MNEVYLDIHISAPPDELIREIIPSALSDLGFEGFLEDDRGIHCYVKKELWNSHIDAVLKAISDQFNLECIDHISTIEVPNRNWNEEWEKTIQPIKVTDRIIITPSWHEVKDDHSLVLTIDPKMTFGTGYHESTRLMLRLMEKYITHDCTVLDIGTGTGILAIAALKLGAKHAIGIDIDEWTLQNGIENAQRNDVAENCEIRIGSLETVPESSFDIILANIIRRTILDLMDEIILKISTAGKILFSGLLISDRDTIESALITRGFNVSEIVQENEWIGLVAQRA